MSWLTNMPRKVQRCSKPLRLSAVTSRTCGREPAALEKGIWSEPDGLLAPKRTKRIADLELVSQDIVHHKLDRDGKVARNSVTHRKEWSSLRGCSGACLCKTHENSRCRAKSPNKSDKRIVKRLVRGLHPHSTTTLTLAHEPQRNSFAWAPPKNRHKGHRPKNQVGRARRRKGGSRCRLRLCACRCLDSLRCLCHCSWCARCTTI